MIESSSENIMEPYYLKGYININGKVNNRDPYPDSTNDMHLLVLKEGDQYQVYTKKHHTVELESFTEEAYRDMYNVSLDATLNMRLKSIQKLSEEKSNADHIITYQGTFKIEDIEPEYKKLFDNFLEFYVDNVSGTDYKNIEVIKTIKLNQTKKEIVSITYDLTRLLTQAYQDTRNENIIGNFAYYEFTFEKINKVTSDLDFIDEMILGN